MSQCSLENSCTASIWKPHPLLFSYLVSLAAVNMEKAFSQRSIWSITRMIRFEYGEKLLKGFGSS